MLSVLMAPGGTKKSKVDESNAGCDGRERNGTGTDSWWIEYGG
jgi:hypothetical protein